jgi:hypothetical protein
VNKLKNPPKKNFIVQNQKKKKKMLDARFAYPEPPVKRDVWKQALQNAETVVILPSNKSETHFEFELPGRQATYLFGAKSGFKVKGVFECKAGNEDDTKYDKIPAADYATCQLQPNWFEMLLKNTEVFHNNSSLKCDDVPRYANNWLNKYLYGSMDNDIKRCLFPELCHPGRSVPSRLDKWTMTANSEWHEYSKHVFGKSSCVFRYVPTNVFPFYQQANFCLDGEPAAIPMSILNKMTFSLQFRDDFDCIFIKPDTNTKDYRFRIESIELVVQEARLNPAFERSYLTRTKPLYFKGVTKFALVENIAAGVLQHRVQFPNVEMPEGLFIFALPKAVMSGEYKYKSVTTALVGKELFQKHNIDVVDVVYKDMPLAIKTPNLGNVREHMMEVSQYFDHMTKPPFGILQNLNNFTLDDIKEGGENSLFPHLYLNFCPSGSATRLAGHGEEGKTSTKPGNLDLNLRFRGTGSATDVTYFFYIFFTDYAMVLDYKEKQFYPVYKRSRPNL